MSTPASTADVQTSDVGKGFTEKARFQVSSRGVDALHEYISEPMILLSVLKEHSSMHLLFKALQHPVRGAAPPRSGKALQSNTCDAKGTE